MRWCLFLSVLCLIGCSETAADLEAMDLGGGPTDAAESYDGLVLSTDDGTDAETADAGPAIDASGSRDTAVPDSLFKVDADGLDATADLGSEPGSNIELDAEMTPDSTAYVDMGQPDIFIDSDRDASDDVPDAAPLLPDLGPDASLDASPGNPDAARLLPDLGLDASDDVPDAAPLLPDLDPDASLDASPGNPDAAPMISDLGSDAAGDQPDVAPELADLDEDGFSVADGDCDDQNPNINPAAFQFCDGIDSDCDPETIGAGAILMNGTDPFNTLHGAIAAAGRTRARDTIVLCDGTHAMNDQNIEIRNPLTIRSQNGRDVTSIVSPKLTLRSEVLIESVSIVGVLREANVDRAIYARERGTLVTLRDVRMTAAGPDQQWTNMVHVGRSATLVMESVIIENGFAEFLIGTQVSVRDTRLARLISRGADLRVTDSQVTQDARIDDYNPNNVGAAEFTRTRFDGARLDVGGRVPVTLNEVVIENNELDDESAIMLEGDAVITMIGGAIRNNQSNGVGRAVTVGDNRGGALILNNVSVTDNRSRGNGGALYMRHRASVEINGGEWLRNRAIGEGGAIYLRDGILSANDVDFGEGANDNLPTDVESEDEEWSGGVLTFVAQD